jgi:hypothetical protein
MSFQIDTDLLAAASSLGPMISQNSAVGEQNRRVPGPVMNALKAPG